VLREEKRNKMVIKLDTIKGNNNLISLEGNFVIKNKHSNTDKYCYFYVPSSDGSKKCFLGNNEEVSEKKCINPSKCKKYSERMGDLSS
jgi:hypothetical protein